MIPWSWNGTNTPALKWKRRRHAALGPEALSPASKPSSVDERSSTGARKVFAASFRFLWRSRPTCQINWRRQSMATETESQRRSLRISACVTELRTSGLQEEPGRSRRVAREGGTADAEKTAVPCRAIEIAAEGGFQPTLCDMETVPISPGPATQSAA